VDGRGVLGFFLFWQGSETHLHMERVATLICGSFWATMTGAPFTGRSDDDPTSGGGRGRSACRAQSSRANSEVGA
jgi:hypothetical protein